MPPRKGQLAGQANPAWKGGRTITAHGYVLLKLPGHPLADSRGYVYEHRLRAAEILGRPLKRSEIVHHLNHDKSDNRRENLEIVSHAVHAKHHRRANGHRRHGLRDPGEQNTVIACACGCGATFDRFDRVGRERRFVSGHNLR